MKESYGAQHVEIAWQYSDATSNDIIQAREVIPASFSRVTMPANALTSTRVPTNAPTTSMPTNPAPGPSAGDCLYYIGEASFTAVAWSPTTTYVMGDIIRYQNKKYMCETGNVSLCNSADYSPSVTTEVWRDVWIYQEDCPVPPDGTTSTASPTNAPTTASPTITTREPTTAPTTSMPTNSAPGPSTGDCLYYIGDASFTAVPWSSTTTYVLFDIIRYQNKKYMCETGNVSLCNSADYSPSVTTEVWRDVWIYQEDCPVPPDGTTSTASPTNAPTTASPTITTREPTTAPTTSMPTNSAPGPSTGDCLYYIGDASFTAVPWSSTTTYVLLDIIRYQNKKYMCETGDVSLCNSADYSPSVTTELWRDVWIYQEDCPVPPDGTTSTASPTNAPTTASPTIMTREPTTAPTTSMPTNSAPGPSTGDCLYYIGDASFTAVPWSSTTTYVLFDIIRYQNKKYMCETGDVSLCNSADYSPSVTTELWRDVWIYQEDCPVPPDGTTSTASPTNAPTTASPTNMCTYMNMDGVAIPVYPWSSSTSYTSGDHVRLNDQKYMCNDGSGQCNWETYKPTTDPDGIWRNVWIISGICG
jgi:hypothetical protein